MTSSLQINSLLKDVEEFIGCYPCNKLPNVKVGKKGVFIIINTDKDGEDGDHWVALAMYKKKCFYFDSFGVQILNSYIINFLQEYNYNNILYSNVLLQPYYSDLCGFYAASFILAMWRKYNYNFFLKLYNFDNIFNNDKIVFTIIDNLINL